MDARTDFSLIACCNLRRAVQVESCVCGGGRLSTWPEMEWSEWPGTEAGGSYGCGAHLPVPFNATWSAVPERPHGSVLGTCVGVRRFLHLSVFLTASRMVLPQDPSTTHYCCAAPLTHVRTALFASRSVRRALLTSQGHFRAALSLQ